MRLVPCPSCKRHVFAREERCPHCGTSGTPFVLALTALVAVACSESVAPVYGPATVDVKTRETSASATATAPARVDADVYGPAPVEPELRTSASASSAANYSHVVIEGVYVFYRNVQVRRAHRWHVRCGGVCA